jgi:hypothetical protein
VNAVPSYHQDKNGLAERHWQTMITMPRSRLTSAELPLSFWFYAAHCAEVCNYFLTSSRMVPTLLPLNWCIKQK